MSIIRKILDPEQIMEYHNKCVGCTMCQVRCPVDIPKRLMHTYMRVGEYDKANEVINYCMNCNSCEVSCPYAIAGFPLIEDVRTYRPIPRLQEIKIDVMERGNPYPKKYGFDKEKRLDWVKKVKVDSEPTSECKDLFGRGLLFTGCVMSYEDIDSSIAALKTMKMVGLDVEAFKDEACCTSILIRAGVHDNDVEEMAKRNVENLEKYDPDFVVTLCPTCYLVLNHDYEFLVGETNYEVFHYSEIMARALEENIFEFKNPINELVTYHDSCHLVTGPMKVIEEPRKVLRKIPELQMKEMLRKGKWTRCCGGSLRLHQREAMKGVAWLRVMQATKTKATTLVTTCPLCKKNLRDGVKEAQVEMDVYTLPEIVDTAFPSVLRT